MKITKLRITGLQQCSAKLKQMNMRSILYGVFFLAIALSLPVDADAQMIKSFHNNKSDYFLDATQVLEYTSNKKYLAKGEELLESFGGVWESGYFKPHHREKIYKVSNLMLARTMRSYPHFYDFYSILVLCVENKLDDNSLDLWLSELDTIGRQKLSSGIPDFLEFSRRLFEHNILYETRSRSWYFRNGGFVFDYDSAFLITFEQTDLVCSTRRDSMELKQTSGRYSLHEQLWNGQGGRISWHRAGYHEDSVYASLDHYHVDLKDLSFKADSVVFYNKHFFDYPVLGALREKVLSSAPGKRATYPRFTSYLKDYEAEGFYKNVKYIGGIGMEGRKLVCTGNEKETYAKFIFKKGGDYFALIRSRTFFVEDDEIVASPAAFSIYFEKDSIYHPGLRMKYDHKTKVLSLVRLNRGSAQSPFFNAFHDVNMNCEALYWVMDSEEISFEVIRNLSPESRAGFESEKYYSAFDYYKLEGIDEENPLVLVRKYAERYDTDIVQVGALADFIRKPPEQAIAMLLLLESKGFVVYSYDRREAIIKQRLFDYLEAHAGKTDYDVIHFDSHTYQENNATIELATFDMLIKGVPEIFLSDSQSVYIYPAGSRIVMKENMDFTFSGKVRAGLFEFYARDCAFNYDSFRIDMPQIDSMSFFVRVRDEKRNRDKLVRVRAVVESMNGYIIIDDPMNKSGLKSFPQYPTFTSVDHSFVYYDKNEGMEGVYNREDFYYELEPFTLDSLDNFSTKGLKFKGYLSTGGILPRLDDELVVQEDFSLGVNSFTDQNGLPLYGGKAMFYDTIRMDNSGLHGEGRMEYLTSVTESSEMDFFPDSVVSLTRSFKVKKLLSQVEYADVEAGVTRQYWFPDSNLMEVNTIKDPINMFDNTSALRGSLALSPAGMTGKGDFSFERARIESDAFAFKHHSMAADTSDFKLYADTSFTELAFKTEDYRTDLDFDQRQGKFISSGLSSLVDMPFNKYICYMDELYWDMDAQIFELNNNAAMSVNDLEDISKRELIDLELSGSDFISTVPGQDSLRFYSTRALYDISKNIIYAEDVNIVKSADAAVFPAGAKLTILKDGVIETLQDAELIVDTANKYHHFFDASVNIRSRHDYAATALLPYVDILGDKDMIYMRSIGVDSNGRSSGRAHVSDSLDFYLNPWYSFAGDVELKAGEQFMRFNGSFALEHDCFPDFGHRAMMDTLVDPRNVLIPIPDSLPGHDEQRVYTSLAFSPEKEDFYPAFLTGLDREEDVTVLSASGLLSYSIADETYTIRERNAGQYAKYLSLHKSNCLLEGTGPMDLSVDLPYIDMDIYGKASHFIIPNTTQFSVAIGFDFLFDEELLKMISTQVNATNLPGANASDPYFLGFMQERLPEGEVSSIVSELASFGTVKKLPETIMYTLLFSKLDLRWNALSSSFISEGDIGIFSMGNSLLNRKVPGYFEINRRPDGFGEVNIYFELPDGEWYYFNYRNYILQAISSNEEFNTALTYLDQKKRLLVDKEEDMAYEYVISSKRKMVDFKRRMEEIKRAVNK